MSEPALPRILIVDDSRIVRATIIKRIRDCFDVREEADGEAGWEALLIDPTLQLVVTDHSMPRLDGYGLLERIRASRVARIRDLPVIMISGDEGEEARQRAKDLGATDFITKGIGTAELLARLDSLVGLGRAQGALEAVRHTALNDLETGVLARTALLDQAGHLCSFAKRHGVNAGALVIGLDGFDDISDAVGERIAGELLKLFAALLAGLVRKEDSLGRWGGACFAVVSPGIDGYHARSFADRLRQAIAAADIECGGGRFELRASIGVASCPDDGETGEAVLAVAEQRANLALAAGGNRVEGGADSPTTGEASVDEALAAIAAGRIEEVRARLPALGRKLLPLLGLLARESRFEFPMAEMMRRLSETEGEVQQTVSTT